MSLPIVSFGLKPAHNVRSGPALPQRPMLLKIFSYDPRRPQCLVKRGLRFGTNAGASINGPGLSLSFRFSFVVASDPFSHPGASVK